MQKLLLVVAWLVACLGACFVALLPFELLSASLDAEKKMPSLFGAIPLLCIGAGLLVIALQFIRKKDAESAVFLAQAAGLAAWIGTTGIAKHFSGSKSPLTDVANIVIPVLLGVAVYWLLSRGVVTGPHKKQKNA